MLENTIKHLKDNMRIGVIEGDIQTSADAERIIHAGASAVQINTDGACHLDGNMIKALANKGFQVFTPCIVPTNDGGISLGQAVAAAAIARNGN